jgi:tellurite resistance protein TehA-like permease
MRSPLGSRRREQLASTHAASGAIPRLGAHMRCENRHGLGRAKRVVPVAAGSVVMGTGIVAVALSADSQRALSAVVLALTALAWVLVAALLATRALRERPRLARATPPLLSCVAGTSVLGAALLAHGAPLAAAALLALALALWLVFLPATLAAGVPRDATSFMLAISTQSLAALAASLAAREHLRWLLYAALGALVSGTVLYAAALARFDVRQLATARGEHWTAGGALAIAALAAGQATVAARALHLPSGMGGALEVSAIVLWALALAWLPLLLACELRWARWRYDLRRWATVFPVGMYAACTFAVANAARDPALADPARGWVWFAVALWLVVSIAMLWQVAVLARRTPASRCVGGG